MNRIKQRICCFMLLVIMIVTTLDTYAQALPVANMALNRAVAGAITKSVIRRGFAVNDPRYLTTLNSVSNSLSAVNVASTAAGLALTVAGAPVWLTIAAGVGVFAVGALIVAGTTSVGLQNNKLVVTKNGMPESEQPNYVAPGIDDQNPFNRYVNQGVPVYKNNACQAGSCTSLPTYQGDQSPAIYYPVGERFGTGAYAAHFNFDDFKKNYLINGHMKVGQAYSVQDGNASFTEKWEWKDEPKIIYSNGKIDHIEGSYKWTRTCAGGTCEVGKIVTDTGIFDTRYTTPVIKLNVANGQVSQFDSADAALSNLGRVSRYEPLSDQSIATLADSAWKYAASQPGYQGIPYSTTDPVTIQDAKNWLTENPTSAPSMNDLFNPASGTGTNAVPLSDSQLGNTNQNQSPGDVVNVNVINAPRVNLGPDPGIGSPNLEPTPTIPQILSPLLNLAPGLRNYTTPNHQSICPVATFAAFGKQQMLDQHCKLFESNRVLIVQIMYAVYVLAGLLIVLKS